ncbi:MAG: hypothetical protein MUC97_18810 [Bernardetiaceae bacterium]|nr:hypothetical protein [Bernardetiaceae bacterium]
MSPQAFGQFFNQDFNLSGTVGDYASATPNLRQFDNITNGTNNNITISGNALRFARTGGHTASGITRATNIADHTGAALASPQTSLMIRFTIGTVTTANITGTPLAGTFQVGSGFAANTTVEATPYAQFGIHFGLSTTNTFRLSSAASVATVNAGNLAQNQRVTIALNNSGGPRPHRL